MKHYKLKNKLTYIIVKNKYFIHIIHNILNYYFVNVYRNILKSYFYDFYGDVFFRV